MSHDNSTKLVLCRISRKQAQIWWDYNIFDPKEDDKGLVKKVIQTYKDVNDCTPMKYIAHISWKDTEKWFLNGKDKKGNPLLTEEERKEASVQRFLVIHRWASEYYSSFSNKQVCLYCIQCMY